MIESPQSPFRRAFKNTTTLATDSLISLLIKSVVAMNALCLSSVLSRWSGSSKNVFSITDWNNVFRVYARSVVAAMVAFKAGFVLPFRNGSVPPKIEQSVGFVSSAFPKNPSVSTVKSASPNPAASRFIDSDFRQHTLTSFCVERCGKIGVSHDSVSCTELGLGPLRGDTRRGSFIIADQADEDLATLKQRESTMAAKELLSI